MTKEEKLQWKHEAIRQRAKFIIAVCDTFDGDYYPVFCKDEDEMRDKKVDYSTRSMQKIMEVIEL